VTAVHCETPSGVLNPLGEVGEICREAGSLLYVDFVASGGGVPVDADACHIDLGLLGSQKALSLLPDLSMVTVSRQAWEAVEEVDYAGYDALKPWRTGWHNRYLPYTHNWHGLASLRLSLDLLLDEGLPRVFERHTKVAAYCRQRLEAMKVRLFPVAESFSSPTVTAAYVPEGWTWERLDTALRSHGMVVGGNYGPLAGKVFRIGHMGSQANMSLVQQGLDILDQVLRPRASG
jgi:aspartate aminotransferase-like enzyme